MSEELKNIASQLRQPHGEKGLEIAAMMNVTNLGMTLHSIQTLGLSKGDRVLEIGPGNAEHLVRIFTLEPDLIYTGLDISDLMHSEAQRINQRFMQEGKADFVLYDGDHLPFGENMFTKIFTVNTLYFWPHPLVMLKELYRVLEPQGKCSITFSHKESMVQIPFTAFGFNLYTLQEAIDLVNKSLFKITKQATASGEVVSKTGEKIIRNFTSLTLEK